MIVSAQNERETITQLVIDIQGGHNERRVALWEAVRGFIAKQARRRFDAVGPLGGCEVEDLIQEGYIALSEAIEEFRPDRETVSFLSLLSFKLSTVFSAAEGLRTPKRDALSNALSLDAPAENDNPDAEPLSSFIADPADGLQTAEDRVFTEDLRRALLSALDTLSPGKREIIQARYFEGQEQKEIAKIRGSSASAIAGQEREALRILRRNSALKQFVEERTTYYRPAGMGRFSRTGMSAVEETVLQRERLGEELIKETEYTIIQ